MERKICIVSGGNSGIGKYTCLGMMKKGFKVIMLCRDLKKANSAIEEITVFSKSDDIESAICDYTSFKSIKNFTEEFLKRFNRLDVLINNAGAFYDTYSETEDGYESQWQVNHLAGFYLTNLLLPVMNSQNGGRIVNVSSAAHYNGRINISDVNRKAKYDGIKAYCQSKLANVMIANELSRRYIDQGISANSLHPGVVKTSFGQKNSKGLYDIIWRLSKPFMISEREGARTSIFLGSSEKVNGITGKYFEKCKIKKPSPQAMNAKNCEKLWALSLKMVPAIES